MLLAERLALLLLEPRRGSVPADSALHLQTLFGAALLADLVLIGRLRARAGRCHMDDALPLAHPLLSELQRLLGAGPLSASVCLARTSHGLPRLRERLLDALARRDLVHRVPRIRLLPRAGLRYPLRSQQAHAQVLTELQHAARNAASSADYALLILADSAGLLRVLPADLHSAAYAALGQLDNDAATLDENLAALALLRQALLDGEG